MCSHDKSCTAGGKDLEVTNSESVVDVYVHFRLVRMPRPPRWLLIGASTLTGSALGTWGAFQK